MRKAELIMALVMLVFSVYLMWKSTELPIGWIPEEGPGGGAFSFWLGAGMVICCITIIVRWAKRQSPPSQSDEPFMDREAMTLFFVISGSLAAMIGGIHVVGVYFSVPIFMAFYMRYLGRHSWKLIAAISVVTPIVTFFFFEIALLKTLPKGITEPLFYPLYDIFL
ncbi:MAG: tripartite tricarboxylate transporter TctB family protein [Rhodospirillaceae bacterium]|nr:tripartite tricarboxylate transporter TctB family protein [Rhodospirillaceae bacterium]MBT5299386.1 tripartite tricarboxylate transporter TctB family protein [Rhodospirillaceae bacterium]MBT7510666.1 tripartite tricarboxylate transporter TctB family protein [Rhodospirillaceae bacterium]